MPKLQITYFAILREQRGVAAETIETSASTARALYTELQAKHRFSLPAERLRIAIDGEFASWDAPVRDGQQLALIPPVAGG
jgi:molybdopterin synthase sulfur carrier subunit